jgi:hypothetical protein
MYYASLTDVGEKTTVDGLKMDVHSPSKVEAKHKPVYVFVCLFVGLCWLYKRARVYYVYYNCIYFLICV